MLRFADCLSRRVATRGSQAALIVLILLAVALTSARATAATPVRITMDPASSTTPATAMGTDGNCRIVWSDSRTGDSEIFFTLLDAWGNRLLPDIQVSHSPGVSSTVPRVDVDAQGFAYICWLESKTVWLAKLDPTGHTIISKAVDLGFNYLAEFPDFDVTPSSGVGVGFTSQSGVSDEDYLVLYDPALNKICQRRMFTNLTWFDRHVTVRCDDDLHCTMYWQSSDLFAGQNLTGGAITPTCGDFGSGNICSGSDYSAMSNHAAGLIVQKGSRIQIGSGGGCTTGFSELPGPSVAPSARTLDNTRSVVAWEDRRNSNADIYYAVYTNATRAKTGVDSLLAGGASSSTAPSVTSDQAGTAFVAWQDDRDGNNEIYFARTPLPAGYGTIVGTVYDAVTGQPMPFAQVDIVYPDRPTPPQPLKIGHVVAGANGQYRLAGLAPSGPWALSASSAGFVSPQTSGIVVPAGQTVTVDLRVSTGSVLSGIIRDEFNGLPIGTAEVRVDSVAGTVTKGMETGPDGRFRFDLYPGTYNVHVSVPSLGQPGPFLSLANPFYAPDSALGLVLSASSPPLAFKLKTRTVVLVHGILSNNTSWGSVIDPLGQPDTMRIAIERGGWHTEALSYDWKRSIEEGGWTLSRWLQPSVYRSSRVVAHSMGGLTSRWCAEQIAAPANEHPFAELITLGTLHHGTPLASHGVDLVKAFAGWATARLEIPGLDLLTDLAVEAAIRKWIPFAIDFEPGSERLNQLNYGPGHSGTDGERYCFPGLLPDPTHAPETLLPDMRYVAMAGDSPQDLQWVEDLFMNGCSSDGAVPVHSAKLYNTGPNVSSYVMSEFGCDVRHSRYVTQSADAGPQLMAEPINFKNSTCVQERVLDALSGVPLTPRASDALAGTGTSTDTLMSALPAFEHLLGPAGSSADTVLVPAGARLAVLASWRQDGLVLTLEDPSGTHIDSVACANVPGRFYQSDPASAWSRIEIANAAGGKWILHATAIADSAQIVSLRPYLSGDVTLDAAVTPDVAAPGVPLRVTASLQRAAAPLTGASVAGAIGSAEGGTRAIALVDNGTGGDLVSGDGIYSAVFTPDSAGTYAMRVRASGGAGPDYGGRERLVGFQALPRVDVAIPAASLSASGPWAYPSDLLTYSFRVRNDGSIRADSVWVVARDESLGTAFMDTVVAIGAQDSVTLQARFRATQLGLHLLRFTAGALGGAVDANPANSMVSRLTEIVGFGAAPTFVAVDPPVWPHAPSVYLLTRAVPNPSRGTTAVEFFLPHPSGQVRLSVFDVAGRLVSRSDYGAFASGWQRLSWEPRRAGGTRISSGVYLYRVESAGLAGQGRFVIVR